MSVSSILLQRLGITRAVIPEFPGSYRQRSRFVDASLKSLPRWNRVFAAKAGRRKGRGNAQSICFERIARARTENRENARATLFVVARSLSRGSIDRSIEPRRGREVTERNERISRIKKGIWNLWAWYRRGYDRYFERGMLENDRAFLSSNARDKERR